MYKIACFIATMYTYIRAYTILRLEDSENFGHSFLGLKDNKYAAKKNVYTYLYFTFL